MKKPPIPPAQAGYQTVPKFISMPTPGAAIPSGFTYQNVSGHAGLVPFWGCLHWQRFHALLAGVRPHVRTSPKAIPPADLALGFIALRRRARLSLAATITISGLTPSDRAPSFQEMSQRLERTGAKVSPDVPKTGQRAGAIQDHGRLQTVRVQPQGRVVPDMIEHKAAGGRAVTIENVFEDGALPGDRGKDRRIVRFGMVDEQLVMPERHSPLEGAAALADACEQFAGLLAAKFQAPDEARHGLGSVEERAGRGGK